MAMVERRFRLVLLAIVILAVLVRAAVMARGPAPFDDPDNYLPLARSLRTVMVSRSTDTPQPIERLFTR